VLKVYPVPTIPFMSVSGRKKEKREIQKERGRKG
jgi:hypothetical protein